PSPGLERAAEYVAQEFKRLGLKPAGDSGTYVQRWPFKQAKLDVASLRAELRGGTTRTLNYGQDFFLIASPSVDTVSGNLIFAGVAGDSTASAPKFNKQIATFFIPGAIPTPEWEKALQAAFVSAMTGGASGLLFILDPQFASGMIAAVSQVAGQQQAPLPLIAVAYDAARDWLKTLNVNLDSARVGKDANVLAKGSMFLRTSSGGNVSHAPNVVGIIEGSDPTLKDTYVVYTAHIDHVGVGQPDASGDSIYNGADDDASGTTAVIEIAEAFAALTTKPKRSIIFALVSGEEKGLYGSAYFVEHPPVPAKQMIANINIDMIGRNASDSTVAIGQDYTSLGPIMQEVNRAHPELKLTVAPDLWPQENLFVRSDHFNFAKAEIPAIFFTSGLHADYHKPSDEPETIDNDKLARTAQLLFYLGHHVAENRHAPIWTEAGLKIIKGN
ncbi:MAG TPA: M20/M25/M40 family metallo-hydrolase, partial [Longimicrobiales bacterium]|nr:M20/M25/M40 family metallo-hydrolase [Longimicrobiales bacterium]